MADRRGITGRLIGAYEERTGGRILRADEADELSEALQDARVRERDFERLRYDVLNAQPDSPDLSHQDRLKFVKEAREIWQRDALLGAAVDLMNDFTFGSGVPRPRSDDAEVQKVLDEAWDDADNALVLTSHSAQMALGTDLSLQSNIFPLAFDGDDGKVKLGLLNHDTVRDVVRDPDNRLRVMYFVAREESYEWDFEQDKRKPVDNAAPGAAKKVAYYAHWRNVEDKREAGESFDEPKKDKRGEGVVYHVAINRTSEMAFGVPVMRRVIKWAGALNEFMAARVDLTKATAAFIMKRTIKGGPQAVAQQGAKQLSRRAPIGSASLDGALDQQPRPGSILNENEQVTHSALNLSSNAANAQQDAAMLRSPLSAALRFPPHYFGDTQNASLATATAAELPVLKAIASRQELFEQLFRWFNDRVIAKAVEAGRLTERKSAGELEEARHQRAALRVRDMRPDRDERPEAYVGRVMDAYDGEVLALREAETEEDSKRDLSYEFSMPNPLKRMMGELIGGVGDIAKTFDPNGTNIELTRALLAIALGEGLEVHDPAALVKRAFPEGYQDPALAALAAQQAGGGMPDNFVATDGPDGTTPPSERSTTGADGKQRTEDNAYGAPRRSQDAEDVQEAAVVREDALDEAWAREVNAATEEALAEIDRAYARNGMG